MRKWLIIPMAGLMILATSHGAWADPVDLFQWIFRANSTIYDSTGTAGDSTLPPNFNLAGFDTLTGLGSITVQFATPDSYNFIAFLDHELWESANGFTDEFGAAVGTPGAGQSWEIDEPGFTFGDIYHHVVLAGALDNTNGVPSSAPDDVSMALGWSFSLLTDQTATIALRVATTAPASGFYLVQTDSSNDSIYFSSTLDVQGTSVPEPGTILLLAVGLGGLLALGRKRARR